MMFSHHALFYITLLVTKEYDPIFSMASQWRTNRGSPTKVGSAQLVLTVSWPLTGTFFQGFLRSERIFFEIFDARLPSLNICIFWIEPNPFRSSVVIHTEKQFWLIREWVLTFSRLEKWLLSIFSEYQNYFRNEHTAQYALLYTLARC